MIWNYPLGSLRHGDCLFELRPLAAGSVDLLFADPPYNQGVDYDTYDDARTRAEYLDWTRRWLAEARRVLSPTGSLWLAISDENVAECKLMLDALGLTMRNWVIWYYRFGPHQKKKFGRDHAHLLYYVANPRRFTFNADAVRVPSLRQTLYADKRADPRGRVPGDVWHFPRVCGTFKAKAGVHPNQLPLAMLDRVVLACSNPDDLVADPFAGASASTLVSARNNGRRFWGCELSDVYAVEAARRLSE